ncbi:hypothetical protein RvY_05434 [Ramazzottius varieornatus]|uniref:E2 ubiquitin-conjugating enzyme n=1 Tax=Ramazzottius varieornatus TaxID=947166 RepID=A0A1D1V403_RAMVA|nr:hypothetical protein RvY_05434 [Ramazzottius varieornatus]
MAQKLKEHLKKLESFFPRSHPLYQILSANTDELHVRFHAPNHSKPFDIHCNLPDTYPRSAPLWSSDEDNASLTGLLEFLSSTSGAKNHIFNQVTEMLTSLCSLFGVEQPAEVELLKATIESEQAEGDAEPECESLESDGDGEDDDYPMEMNDLSSQQIFAPIEKDISAEDEGIDEQGQAALERVKKANLERYSTPAATSGQASAPQGSVTASDRLMKELRHIWKSDNHKNGLFSVELMNDNLYEWNVKLFKVDPDSQLHNDMVQMQTKIKLNHLSFSFKFPDTFPFSPPFVRVINPVISGGYVLTGGAICMELLTKQGWSSAYSIEAVILQISATLVKGRARINFTAQANAQYSQARAEESYRHLVRIHEKGGWFTPPKGDG